VDAQIFPAPRFTQRPKSSRWISLSPLEDRKELDVKNLIGTIVLEIRTDALGGCVNTLAASPSETAGPALQPAYCIEHPNEPRCLKL